MTLQETFGVYIVLLPLPLALLLPNANWNEPPTVQFVMCFLPVFIKNDGEMIVNAVLLN